MTALTKMSIFQFRHVQPEEQSERENKISEEQAAAGYIWDELIVPHRILSIELLTPKRDAVCFIR